MKSDNLPAPQSRRKEQVLTLPIAIYSPSNAPEHVRIIDGNHLTVFESQNPGVWPMAPEARAFICKAANNHQKLVNRLHESGRMLVMLEGLLADGPHCEKAKFVHEQLVLNAETLLAATEEAP